MRMRQNETKEGEKKNVSDGQEGDLYCVLR